MHNMMKNRPTIGRAGAGDQLGCLRIKHYARIPFLCVIPLTRFFWKEEEVSEKGYGEIILISTGAPIILSGGKKQ